MTIHLLTFHGARGPQMAQFRCFWHLRVPVPLIYVIVTANKVLSLLTCHMKGTQSARGASSRTYDHQVVYAYNLVILGMRMGV